MSFHCLVLQASRVWVQNKVDESKHEIHSQVDAITAGTASVVNLTAGKSLGDLHCCVCPGMFGCIFTLSLQQQSAIL